MTNIAEGYILGYGCIGGAYTDLLKKKKMYCTDSVPLGSRLINVVY